MERLVIDTETTGLSPMNNQILTVGMLLVDVEKKFLEIRDSSHVKVKYYGGPVNPFALKINKISLSTHNLSAIDPRTACKRINKFILKNNLEETPILGHNVAFDRRFLNSLFERENQVQKLHHIHEDTMEIWKNLQRKGIVPEGKRNLKTVSKHFNVDYSQAHDALADCHITARVYHKMACLNCLI